MDPNLLLGALVFLVGLGAGRFRRPARATSLLPVMDQGPCGCGHSMAMHDPKNGRCHVQELGEEAWSSFDGKYIAQYQRCRCQQYVGSLYPNLSL